MGVVEHRIAVVARQRADVRVGIGQRRINALLRRLGKHLRYLVAEGLVSCDKFYSQLHNLSSYLLTYISYFLTIYIRSSPSEYARRSSAVNLNL